jgi:hypothetical protein
VLTQNPIFFGAEFAAPVTVAFCGLVHLGLVLSFPAPKMCAAWSCFKAFRW